MRIELTTSSLPRKRSTPELHQHYTGAEDEVRTRDPQLGRLMLYRLSYFRNLFQNKSPILLVSGLCGRRWIRTTEGINQQIYSLPHLATLVFSQNSFRTFEPMEGIEPTTPRLQITCSGQLSYIGNVVIPV